MACKTFHILNTSIFLVHDFKDHIYCPSPGVLGNQLKYVRTTPRGSDEITSKSIVYPALKGHEFKDKGALCRRVLLF